MRPSLLLRTPTVICRLQRDDRVGVPSCIRVEVVIAYLVIRSGWEPADTAAGLPQIQQAQNQGRPLPSFGCTRPIHNSNLKQRRIHPQINGRRE
jgi:hypothetical protein